MDEARHGLARGFEIHGYCVERVLGAGGFGVTYLATEVAINRPVAIKEYLPNGIAARSRDDVSVQPLSEADNENFQWGLERFRREAQTLVAFHHANIVSVFSYFEANGTAYLVMAYEDGDSLATILDKRKTMPEAELRAWLTPLLSGLAHVHKAGFLHRDIKPGNIYIRKDGSPVLLDFGAARLAVGSRSQSLTSIVSAGYAPFEQYTTRGNQGPWTDIYALGGVLYRAVTGQRPPDAPDRIRSDPYEPAAKRAAKGKYGAGLLAAIDAALIVDEEKRPQSLEQWLPVFDGAPWPPEAAASAEPEAAPDATLAVGAAPSPRDDPPTRWPVGGLSARQNTRGPSVVPSVGATATAPTQPPASPRGGGKWFIIGAFAVLLLAGAGVVTRELVSGGTPSKPEASATPAQEAARKIGALLGEARAAIAKRDFAAAERALDEAEALAARHDLAAQKQEIAQTRAELSRAKGTPEITIKPPPASPGGIPAGSWPADAELRRAVEETMRKLVQ
jgi:serine/threonine protein kinase